MSQSKKSQKLQYILGFIFLLSLGANIVLLNNNGDPVKRTSVLSAEKVNNLHENMILEQVERVIGQKGYLYTYGKNHGKYAEFYQWKDKNGNDLLVMFHNSKLKGRVLRGRGGWSHCLPSSQLPTDLERAIEHGY